MTPRLSSRGHTSTRPRRGWRSVAGIGRIGFLAFSFCGVQAATLSIEPLDSETLNLRLSQDSANYFYLQQSTDLRGFSPFSMVLGETPSDWNLYLDPETPTRYFRARAISVFAPEDSDGDGIDDVYELRHAILNPLDPYDANLDPANTGMTYLQEYRNRYGLENEIKQAVSPEVSLFKTLPSNGPAMEVISQEVSVFKTLSFAGPASEALSPEVSVLKTLPTP